MLWYPGSLEMIDELEALSVTTDPVDLDRASELFNKLLDLYEYTYFNPGEPEARCNFCDASRALPEVYNEDAYTGDELEEPEFWLDSAVYWARVWAIRALDILDPNYPEEPCCEERRALLDKIEERFRGPDGEPICKQCGKLLSPVEAMMGPVCGDCVRRNHRGVTE